MANKKARKSPNKPAGKKSRSSVATKRAGGTTASGKSSKAKPARKRVSAEAMGEMQRDISISEFFTKNRHLLGFDNASRALLTSVKEAVDNSLDACEEAGILPNVIVRLEQVDQQRYRMIVEDNGPGIVKTQIPKVFGKLLYGSKFHRMRQSRGQQGIGISAAGMYGQLTTGKPVIVTSRTSAGKLAHHYHLVIDTTANVPKIVHEDSFEWEDKEHGTSVTIEMEASYKGGKKSVDEYIQTVASANPHARLEYWRPNRPPIVYPCMTQELPVETKEIKPHPDGIELGIMMRMMQATKARHLSGFLQTEFSRVSQAVATEIASHAKVPADILLKKISQKQIEAVYQAIALTKIMAPPTNCLAPIGETAMLDGIKALLVQQHLMIAEAKARRKQEEQKRKISEARAIAQAEAKVTEGIEGITVISELDPNDDDATPPSDASDAPKQQQLDFGDDCSSEPIDKTGVIMVYDKPCFVTAVTRSPKVYRGNPFQVEAAVAYGGELDNESLAQVHRFANRVPLLYQQGACAMSQAVMRTNWKSYGVQQSRGAMPAGPLLVMVHIASVWVPFTSEAKEAVAHYDEIITELKFALQECGRRLGRHLSRRRKAADAEKKQRYMAQYVPHIGEALQDILGLSDQKRDATIERLTGMLQRDKIA